MSQPSDEELILYYYGEAADPAAIAARIADSPETRRRYASLVSVFAAADQWQDVELPASYEAELWQRLQPRLSRPQPVAELRRFPQRAPRWLPAAAAALLLLGVGYLAGRLATERTPSRQPVGLSAEARQRILVETLAEHLGRSERLFTELANSPADEAIDVEAQRRAADELLAENHLYRTAAERGDHAGIAALLGQMEPLLLDLANLPSDPAPEDVAFLRQRLEAQGLLFKTRVASELLTRSLRGAGVPPSRSRA